MHATSPDGKSSNSLPAEQSSKSDAGRQKTGFPKYHSTESKPQRNDVFCFEVEDEEDEDGEDSNEIAPQVKRVRTEDECTGSQGEILLL